MFIDVFAYVSSDIHCLIRLLRNFYVFICTRSERRRKNRIANIRDDSSELIAIEEKENFRSARNTKTQILFAVYLRFAQLLGSGRAKRRWANAIVAPSVSSVNVRSIDILRKEKKR